MIDWTAAKFFLDMVALGVAAGAWFYARQVKHAAAAGRIGERLAIAEARIEAGASRDQLHKLSLCVSEIEGDVKTVGARLEGVEKVMSRIEIVVNRQEEWLLEHGGRS